MAPRANWKGYLKLSLVSCSIALYPATSTKDRIRFNIINRQTGNRVRYRQIDAETGEDVPEEARVKGYKTADGTYVLLEPEELDEVALESTHTVDIESFVPRKEIDEIYIDEPYYLTPDDKVGVEAFAVIREAMRATGLVGLAMVTGLVFAKFSRPTAKVRFSKVAIVSNRDGIPSLQFRMANMRANRIVDVTASVVFARQERTIEGEEMRRFYDLKLQRDRNAIFIYSWTAIHPITEDSPINGVSKEAMEAASAEIIVSVIGLDETFAQTVHARYSYRARDILWGQRFVDILERQPDGSLSIDYTYFDDVTPATGVMSTEPTTGGVPTE